MAHILVIDDHRLIRELMKHGLKKEGFEVSTAGSAAEGLEVARRERPDIILLDLEMPERNGVDCLRDIRADAEVGRTPVVMVSAMPARDIIVQVAQIGVQGIIVKGETMVAEVLKRVRHLLTTLPAGKAAAAAVLPPAKPPVIETLPTLLPAKPPVFERPVSAQAAKPPVIERIAPSAAPAVRPAAAPSKTKAPPQPISPQEDQDSLRNSMLQLDTEGLDRERAMEELGKLKPLMSRSELLDRVVEGVDLRAIKPAVQQVLALTASASASIDTISKAIKHDQALALKVLKVANSAIYTHGERVETVQKAVARIGVVQIRTTVLSLAVIESFANTGLAGRIKADWFWEHSIACGLLASKIAAIRGQKSEQIDAMFTAGLLHDVGRVIYAERLGDEYAAVIDTADTLGMPLETVESRLLLVNHADLTDRLLRAWNFSPELINPIALHHLSVGNLRRVAPRMAESIATLGLANRLAHALLLGSSGNETLYPIAEFVEFLKLSADDLRKLCDTVPEQTLDTKLQMLAHGGASPSSMLEETQSRLHPHLRPLHVSVDALTNSARILLDRLVPEDPSAAPTLAIVNIANVRQRAQLVTMLRAAEQERGVKNLPTLVLGTSQGCFFAEGMLGARPMEQAVLPIRLNRLLAAMNTLVASAPLAVAA